MFMIDDWNITYRNGRDYSTMNQHLLNEILRRADVKENGAALDVGCGTGDLAVKLARRGFTVTGIDLSLVAIEKAMERSRAANTADKTNFLVLNIEDPEQVRQLKNRVFDLISCKLVYAFLNNRPGFLKWVKTHLRRRGRLILISPVTHLNVATTSRIAYISVDYEVLLAELRAAFSEVKEISTQYFEDWGEARVFVLHD